MSFVYAGNRIKPSIATILNSYVDTFWYWLDGDPRKQSAVPGNVGFDEGDYYREKWKLMHEWMSGAQEISYIFGVDWKYWRFGNRAQQKELENDWVPPAQQILYALQPLPQEPQKRVRIVGPDGQPRSVRIKQFRGVHL